MKENKLIYFSLGIVLSIFIFGIGILLYSKSIQEKPNPYIADNYANFMIVKKNEYDIEYVGTFESRHFAMYPLTKWERTEYAKLGEWKYQVVMSDDMLVSDGYEDMTIANIINGENICRIIYYDDFVEINGMTYTMPAGLNLEWVEAKWEFLCGHCQWYGTQRL